MFEYGEPLSHKSNLELEALAYLENKLIDCEGEKFSNYDTGELASDLMRNDFMDGYLEAPLETLSYMTASADLWVKRHWDDLGALDLSSLGFEDLLSNSEFAREWYNPLSNPDKYRLFVHEQALSCLLSAPELEFLFDKQSEKLEVTPDVISKVKTLHEEYLSDMEKDLRSPHAHARIRAEELGADWHYPINPEMSMLDRLEVLAFGSQQRLYSLINYPVESIKPEDYLNLPLTPSRDLFWAISDQRRHIHLDYGQNIALLAVSDSLIADVVKQLPKNDIQHLFSNRPALTEMFSRTKAEPARGSNSLSALAQEAKTASKALSNNERNIDVKDREER